MSSNLCSTRERHRGHHISHQTRVPHSFPHVGNNLWVSIGVPYNDWFRFGSLPIPQKGTQNMTHPYFGDGKRWQPEVEVWKLAGECYLQMQDFDKALQAALELSLVCLFGYLLGLFLVFLPSFQSCSVLFRFFSCLFSGSSCFAFPFLFVCLFVCLCCSIYHPPALSSLCSVLASAMWQNRSSGAGLC